MAGAWPVRLGAANSSAPPLGEEREAFVVIEIESLTRRFGGRTVLRDVSFRVEEGEVVGFLGPNGAGKTTTLRILVGLLAPSAGRVRVGGFDVQTDPLQVRHLLGYMPEGVPLYSEMRVVEYLRHRAELKGVRRARLSEAVERALELAKVSDAADRIVGQLSKGYRQRVGLADALVADPPLLVLDEPTSGLDPNQVRQVRSLVRSLAGKKTILLSTHILPEVEMSCQRVVILHEGCIVGQGPPGELRGRAGARHVVTVVVRGEAERLRAALEGVESVHAVEDLVPLTASEEGVQKVRLEVHPGGRSAEQVAFALHEAGFRIRELRTEEASLEEVFAALTTEEPDLHRGEAERSSSVSSTPRGGARDAARDADASQGGEG